jgi:hypothetical protein
MLPKILFKHPLRYLSSNPIIILFFVYKYALRDDN